MKNNDIAIDFGSANIRIYTASDGVIIDEPSIVAINTLNNDIVAIGSSAYDMIGKTCGKVIIEYPIKRGIVSNSTLATKMLNFFLSKINYNRILLPRILVAISEDLTPLEITTLVNVVKNCNVKQVYTIYKSIASLIGASVDTSLPQGQFVINIGAGNTELAIVSLNNILSHSSLKKAGYDFDTCIVKYIRKNYNLDIGNFTAKSIKESIGSVDSISHTLYYKVKGMSLMDGLPQTIRINSDELIPVLNPLAMQIAEKSKDIMKKVNPEIIADICNNGLLITGGSAHLRGIFTLMNNSTHLPIKIAKHPSHCVILGAGKVLSYLDSFKNDTILSPINI